MVDFLKKKQINSINFSQTQELLAIGTTRGFQVYSLNPFDIRIEQEWQGGIKWVQLVGATNIILLIPGQTTSNKILIWDAKNQKVIKKIKCQHPIEQISFTNNVCVIPHHNFTSCVCINNKFVYKIDTLYNNKGIHAVSLGTVPDSNGNVRYCIAVPYTEVGQVVLQWFKCNSEQNNHTMDERAIVTVNQSGVAFISLNNEGNLLAVASEKGTLIRVYSTKENRLEYEFRRGTIPATISYLQFDLNSKFLICSSDRSKIHIYNLSDKNTYHSLYYLKYLVSIAGSQWSYYQYQLQEEDYRPQQNNIQSGSKSIIINGKLIIITYSGKQIIAPLTETGGLLNAEQIEEL